MTDTSTEAVRPLDEEFDTQFDVERDPCGAWMAIQTLSARVAELEAALARQWQPIETCPSAHVLFHGNTRHDSKRVFTGWRAVNGRFYSDTGAIVEPTHWMPLPAPPALNGGTNV